MHPVERLNETARKLGITLQIPLPCNMPEWMELTSLIAEKMQQELTRLSTEQK